MIYGYARVSTKDQNLDLQITALKQAGSQKTLAEKVSSRKQYRKELDFLLSVVEKGDSIIIWKLDRIGRSLHELIKIITDLEKKQVDLISLIDNIDTKTPHGKLFFQIVAVFAEYERSMIRERTLAGIKVAREKGRIGGRPKGISKEYQAKVLLALALRTENNKTLTEICAIVGISRSSYYRITKIKDVGKN